MAGGAVIAIGPLGILSAPRQIKGLRILLHVMCNHIHQINDTDVVISI